jgi:MFS family permease
LLLSGIYVTIGALGNYLNSLLIDRMGRKALFIIGLTGMLVSLIFESALLANFSGTTNHAGLSAALFFIFLHLALYVILTETRFRDTIVTDWMQLWMLH